MDFLRSWVGMLRGGESQECPNCEACKQFGEHVLFECAWYDFQRQNFFDYMNQILTLEALEAFNLSSIFDKEGVLLR